ncbi:MAG: hypothetical protein KM310_06920 [Clostridiales bacterium]|nr:hypothetical protein [Clostridiales bacterium]
MKRLWVLGCLFLLLAVSGCGGPRSLAYEVVETGLGAEVRTKGTVEIAEEKGYVAAVRGEFTRRLEWDGMVFRGKGVWERKAGGEMNSEGARVLEQVRGWEKWEDPKGRSLGEAEWLYEGLLLAGPEGAGSRGFVSLRWIGPSGDSLWLGGSFSNLAAPEAGKTLLAAVWESLDWGGKYLLATMMAEKEGEEGRFGLVWGHPLEDEEDFEVEGLYRGPDVPYYLLATPLPVWLFVSLGVVSP